MKRLVRTSLAVALLMWGMLTAQAGLALRGSASVPNAAQLSRFLVAGDYAYVTTTDARLKILNIADRASPTLVSELAAAGAGEVELSGDTLYLAAGGVRAVNVANKSNPVLGTLTTQPQSSALSLEVVGNRLYVGESRGLSIYSITNPAAPQFLGRYASETEIRKVVVRDGLAYCAAHTGGFLIVDVATEANPTRVGGAQISSVGGEAFDLALEGNYAYVTGWPAMVVFDIRNPVTPPIVYSAEHLDYYDAITVRNGIVALAGWPSYAYIYDLRDLPSGGPVATIIQGAFAPNYGADAHFNGDTLILANAKGGLRFYDLSLPTAPAYVGVYATSGDFRSLAVNGDYGYVADAINGIAVFDLTDPAAPLLVGHVPTPRLPLFVTVGGGRLFVKVVTGRNPNGTTATAWEVYSLADPVHPAYIGPINQELSFVGATSDYGFFARNGTIETRSVNPLDPAILATFTHSSSAYIGLGAVDFNGRYIALGGDVIDAADPLALRNVSSGYGVLGHSFYGDLLFTAYGGGLAATRVTPTSTISLGFMPSSGFNPGERAAIAASENMVFVLKGSGNNVFELVDTRETWNMAPAGNVSIDEGTTGLAARGPYAFMVRGSILSAWEGTLPAPIDRPPLQGTKEGANLVIRWPASYTGYSLYARASFTEPWQLVTSNPPQENGFFVYVNRFPVGNAQFYRLVKP